MKRKDTPQRSLYLVSRSQLASPYRTQVTPSSVSCIPRLQIPGKHPEPANDCRSSLSRIQPAIRPRSTASLWLQPDSNWIRTPRAVAAPSISAHTIDSWHQIYTALIPIIGRSGVSTIYQRSLIQTQQTYPWLSDATDIRAPHRSLHRLSTELAAQNYFVARAANRLLQRHYRENLSRLLGQNLTTRLWHPSWGGALPPTDELTDNGHSPSFSNLYRLNPLA